MAIFIGDVAGAGIGGVAIVDAIVWRSILLGAESFVEGRC